MKVGERGQVTIPKHIRDKFAISHNTEVEFMVVGGEIVLHKARRPLNLRKWSGYCADRFREMGFASVDEFMDEVRDR
ncbi:MAG: AbrB/MazE/SpoVT family DNA-binding domain-containing protein [Acidobacteria bacterium]|nr:AbrB/MazE/SpoVT family DNA-binding domain-containing protein [Acidobacteriota bacterium]